jgi:hypothetical protein
MRYGLIGANRAKRAICAQEAAMSEQATPHDRQRRWSVEADEADIIRRLVAAHERESSDELEPEMELSLSITQAEADALERIVESVLTSHDMENGDPAELTLINQIAQALAAQEWLR